jgi:hypothetical protein
MFGTIRRHQTWLWVFLVAVMSVSLVAFFTDNPFKDGARRGEADLGSIDGRPINPTAYLNAWKEVKLTYYLQTGKWPGNDESASRMMERETVSRVFLIQKLKEMNIKASSKAVALMAHEQLRDFPYASFQKEILEPNGLTTADYERLISNESGIRQLISAASVTARLVTPAEAETLWRKENQELSAQLAVFWTSNYLDKVAITNGAIGAFYTNRMGLYRLPERLTVSYAAFAASNYLSEADSKLSKLTNLNEIVSEYYFRGKSGTNTWTDTNGLPLAEAAAKEKIREDIRQNEALLAARRAAADFGNELITQTNANDATNLERLAAAKGLQVHLTKPFDRVSGLDEFEHEESLGRAEDGASEPFKEMLREKALALTPDRPINFSGIPGKRAVYLVALKGKVPSEQQPLDKIQDKVTADYKSYMALEMARKAAQAFHTNLTNGLTLKKPFADLCAAEKVKVVDLPPFGPATRGLTNLDSRISLRMLQNVGNDLEVGTASVVLPAQPGSEGSLILYAKAKPPVDEAKLKQELPDFVKQIRLYRQNEAFQQWFRRQTEIAKVALPKRDTSVGPGAPN